MEWIQSRWRRLVVLPTAATEAAAHQTTIIGGAAFGPYSIPESSRWSEIKIKHMENNLIAHRMHRRCTSEIWN